MPAEIKEIQDAKKEKIEFLFQNNIVKIKGTNKVEKVELIKTELVKKEGEEREYPVDIKNSNYELETDYIVMAIGSRPSEEISKINIDKTKNEEVLINKNYQTSNPKIFAGGDLAGIQRTVAWAARSGRDAANSIISYLNDKV